MREIEAGDVKAGAEQLAEDGFVGRSWSECGDDFSAAQAVAGDAGP